MKLCLVLLLAMVGMAVGETECPKGCTKKLLYVCGSDGNTYDNECELKRIACASNSGVKMASIGECPEKRDGCNKDCKKDLVYVCGDDGVTYSNKCMLELAACEQGKSINVKKNSKCS